VSKTLAMFAMALGILAITAGSSFAGCAGHTQSVAVDTQTASTGTAGSETVSVPVQEAGSE
jgi:hypothetical protein